ncbi:probable cytochrome P450 6a14 [Ischnura elegans]|uniref:probable cytochrome P450 6a14 n=1 Tax=Ischnura elegans TaxID=197161 RepID=UPI001ED8B0C0|nr:probable cytochrome P450 6a14 [Ischnura elegans]XP_046385528.1 probable cytochrome P450 6a14 [Ischnura elegans]
MMTILLQTWFVWLLIFFSASFGLIYLYLTWDYGYWRKRSIPYERPVFPFGSIWSMMTRKESLVEYYRSLYERFKGQRYMGIIMLKEPTLVIRDPGLIKHILVKDFSHFHDRGIPVDEVNDPLSGNLFNLQGKRWHSLRNKLSPTFTSGKLKNMLPIMRVYAEHLIETTIAEMERTGGDLEMKDLMARYTTDVIGSAAFGVEPGALEDSESQFRVIGRRLTAADFGNAFRQMMILFAPSLALKLGVKSVDSIAETYFNGIVKETVSYREKNGVKRPDFLQTLIGLRSENKGNSTQDSSETDLTLEQLMAQCFIFFVGGFETSSSVLTYTLYELSRNLDVQQKLRDEVDRVLGEHGGEITYEALTQMQYMDCVTSETMRMYSPAPLLFRECTKEWRIPSAQETGTDHLDWKPETRDGGPVVVVGTKVHLPTPGLHYDPEYFKDPQCYNPERFTEEGRKHWPQFAYLPFGEGPRICIGMRFGSLQSKVALTALLSKFEFRPSTKTPDTVVLDKMAFFPNIKGGLLLRPIKRCSVSKEA